MVISYADQHLICKDCFTQFVLTAGEQRYFDERGIPRPKRCPTCRAQRRTQRQAASMFYTSNNGVQSVPARPVLSQPASPPIQRPAAPPARSTSIPRPRVHPTREEEPIFDARAAYAQGRDDYAKFGTEANRNRVADNVLTSYDSGFDSARLAAKKAKTDRSSRRAVSGRRN